MLIWRGYGILVALIAIGCLIGTRVGAENLWGKPLPMDKRQLAELVGMLTASALVYGLHLALEKSSPPRTVVDKETGQEIKLVAKHDLFFIPVKYWSYVLAAFGVLFFFQR